MSPPPPLMMYNHYPYVSHMYSNSQQLNHLHFGVGPAPFDAPRQYAASTLDFTVCFKFANVSVCSGCRQHFSPSEDLLIRHAEFRLYNSPVTGAMASKFGNVYYHSIYCCVKKKWPEFTPAQLCVPVEVVEHLCIVHKSLLAREFGIKF